MGGVLSYVFIFQPKSNKLCESSIAVLNTKGILTPMGEGDNKLGTLKAGIIINGNTTEQTFTICNSDSPLITDYTDTAKSDEIPVVFSGSLYNVRSPSDPAATLMFTGDYIKVESL